MHNWTKDWYTARYVVQRWWTWLALTVLGLLLTPFLGWAATLEIPSPYTTLSGIGVISGWKCEAGELTVRFDGGDPLPLVHGSERGDVLNAGACDHPEVGFVSIMNWGELGDGQHTAVIYDDGVEFDRSIFNVVTPGEAFVQGAAGQCVVEDFPLPGNDARFLWNQATQHLELVAVRQPPPRPRPGTLQEQWNGGLTYAGWRWEEEIEFLEIEFTIHTNVVDWSDHNGLFLALADSEIGGADFYFGLQTDLSRPGVGQTRRKGAIFSRWGTRTLEDTRTAPGGFSESAGYEGDFISVRRHYDWATGTYRARLARHDSDRHGDWFGLWITDLDQGRTTWIGSLRFPRIQGRPAKIAPSQVSFVELYGAPLSLIDIPEWHVSITAPLGGWEVAPRYTYTRYREGIPNTDIWYQANENAVHMRVGGTTVRQTIQSGVSNRYWLPPVE